MLNESVKICKTCGGVGKVLNDGIWVKCNEDGCVDGFIDLNKILSKPDVPKTTQIKNETYSNDIELFDSVL